MENEKEIVQKRIERMQRKVSGKANVGCLSSFFGVVGVFSKWRFKKSKFNEICGVRKYFSTEVSGKYSKVPFFLKK